MTLDEALDKIARESCQVCGLELTEAPLIIARIRPILEELVKDYEDRLAMIAKLGEQALKRFGP